MVTHYIIKFPEGKLPSMQLVVKEIENISGLPIVYDAERFCLSSVSIKTPVALYQGDNNDYMITAFVRKTDYLMVTAIVVLKNLGGDFKGILPEWSGRKWNDMNKFLLFFKRYYIYYD